MDLEPQRDASLLLNAKLVRAAVSLSCMLSMSVAREPVGGLDDVIEMNLSRLIVLT